MTAGEITASHLHHSQFLDSCSAHLNMSLVLTGSTHTQFTTLVRSARRRGISCLQALNCESILVPAYPAHMQAVQA